MWWELAAAAVVKLASGGCLGFSSREGLFCCWSKPYMQMMVTIAHVAASVDRPAIGKLARPARGSLEKLVLDSQSIAPAPWPCVFETNPEWLIECQQQ